MKTGFYFTPREFYAWWASVEDRMMTPGPPQVTPGDYIVVTDEDAVEWRMDIVDEHRQPAANRDAQRKRLELGWGTA